MLVVMNRVQSFGDRSGEFSVGHLTVLTYEGQFDTSAALGGRIIHFLLYISPVVHAGQAADGLLHAELDGSHELRRLELLVGHLAVATHATVAQLPLLLTLTLPLLMRLKEATWKVGNSLQ